MVLTDGKQTTGRFAPDALALFEASKPLKEKGVQVFSLGITAAASKAQLIEIASADEHAFKVETFGELADIVNRIKKKICIGKCCDYHYHYELTRWYPACRASISSLSSFSILFFCRSASLENTSSAWVWLFFF